MENSELIDRLEICSNLRNPISHWERAHLQAILNWLQDYQPLVIDKKLDLIKGYLEAFYLFCELNDYQKAGIIFDCKLPSSISRYNNSLHVQLNEWGYYSEQIKMCEILGMQENISPDLCLMSLLSLSNAYCRISNYSKALYFSKEALHISKENNNPLGMANSLINLGITQQIIGERKGVLSQWRQAILSFEESLKISKKHDLWVEQARVLGNLGVIYGIIRRFGKASAYLEQSLVIARQVGDRMLEAQALGNLGNAYGYLKKYDKSEECLENYRDVAREQGNRSNLSTALNSLGELYRRTKKYEKAIDCLQESIALAQATGEQLNQGIALGNLGSVYGNLGDFLKAIEYHQQSLAIARQINDRQGIILGRVNLAIARTLIRLSSLRRKK